MKDPVEIGTEIHEQFERYPESFTMDLSDKPDVSTVTIVHRTPDGKWKEFAFVQFINAVQPELSPDTLHLMSVLAKSKCLDDIILNFENFQKAAIASGRRFGKSFAFQEMLRVHEERINSIRKQPEKRLCDCLQCRMGKYDRCTTFSPRNSKRRGKR